ncbi:MAG: hypothetical protein Dbin4_02552 [Alphaproteobacteria bacterium]|nr:hypothetical protein [Alphaproteobacteria bacterium]
MIRSELGQVIINMHAGELHEIAARWNEFDEVCQVDIARCKELGASLNDIGGLAVMQEVYYLVKKEIRCASVIQSYWDGIGEWRW